ncbi:hypothetical protein [Streptomyces griseosporeus]|uniref:hypothetical protein n=1 Tax=Streptomyces griseosporeus TaxID=1910 RepID=UPI00167EDE73|nr:hypothetical protein [Streptomyces griseosporeus]GHF37045.1 carboxy-S-adenosyl-L-methionine synthase [Streptomyces griseosporeus]
MAEWKNGEPKFSFSTVTDFDAHISTEIRGYEILDEIVVGLAGAIMQSGTNVYDIGCSTGRLINTLASLVASEEDESRRKSVNFIGVEPNRNFVSSFSILEGRVSFLREKVSPATRFSNASLITSIFTFQFIPVHERQEIARNIHSALTPNGAFILAEKVYAKDGYLEHLLDDRHISFKREHRSAEEVLGKKHQLQAIMHPLTLDGNLLLLEKAGFDRYEVFWRVNNFVAMIAVRS